MGINSSLDTLVAFALRPQDAGVAGEQDMLGYIFRSNKLADPPMPELPEVETTRRGVAPHVERHKVTGVRVYDRRLRWPVPRDLPLRLVGRTVDRLDRRSKYLLFRMGADTLIMHFGMTGSLRAFTQPPPRQAHDHIDLEFDNGIVLRYHDPRRFGAMLWSRGAAGTHPLLAALGPEPFTPEFDEHYLYLATRTRSAAIKLATSGFLLLQRQACSSREERRDRIGSLRRNRSISSASDWAEA